VSKKRKKSTGSQRRPRLSPAKPPVSPLAAASRAGMADVWQRAKAGEDLSEEDEQMARAIRNHPEYRELFELGAAGPDEVDGVNPWLHVSMHTVVDRQRQILPEVEAAITRLRLRGLTEHEAEHRIAELVTRLIWSILHDQQPYDEQRYLSDLRALE
jgi:hypothetical protein